MSVNDVNQRAAALYLLKLKKAALSFTGFMEYYYPEMRFKDFQIELQEVLDLLEKDALVSKGGNPVRNLMINMPPRHAKSFNSTINLPAYALMRRPEREIMVSAYNAELAATFGRATRDIVTDQKATKPFSHFELSKESRAVDFWKTKVGGAYYAVGLGGTTTGRGASIMIVDDPYKSREEADSATSRRKIWDFYTSGLLSRMQPDKQGQPAFQIVTHCLAGGTQVSMEDGSWKRLDAIRPGDSVLSMSSDGELAGRAVTAFMPQGEDDVYRIRTSSSSIVGNDRHPIWTPKGWRTIGQLSIGDEVAIAGYTSIHFERVTLKEACGREEVFDITVDGNENFIADGMVVHNTRWHPDDMAGRIMDTPEYKRGEWHHLNFQALTERAKKRYTSRSQLDKSDDRFIPNITNEAAGAEGDPTEPFIEVGATRSYESSKVLESAGEYTALWPERFDVDWLLKQRAAIKEREFAALYQQSPYIVGGNILKTSWLKRYNTLELPELHAIAVTVDTAFKAKSSNDYSVFSVGGITTMGDIYLMKVIREKLEFPDLKRKAIAVNAAYRGQGLRGFWVEDKASGQSLIQELRSDSGVPVIPWKTGTDDKVARANSITPLIEAGRVFVPEEAEWLDDWMSEISTFPAVKHDDQVDSFVMLIDVLSRMVVSGMREFTEPLGNLVDGKGDIRLDSGLLFSNASLEADPNGWLGRGGFGKALDVKWGGWGE